jgi:hypothetical protein
MASAACSGGSKQVDIAAPPDKVTRGTFSGPLCTAGDTCKCASGPADGGAGVPQEGKKRFEVRLNSPNQLWIKVGDHQMYKDAEKPEACWYVDLVPGTTPVEMRASEPNGVAATWSIKELGTKTKSYYDTLIFGCGNPGACSFEELDAKKAELKDPKTDRCGSVKIKGLTWDTGRSPDMQYPSELLVRGTLHIYKFVPDRPHGEDCAGKQKEEHDEDNPKF